METDWLIHRNFQAGIRNACGEKLGGEVYAAHSILWAVQQRGFQKYSDMYFPFNCRLDAREPFRRGEIVGGEDICFIGKNTVLLKGHSSVYHILRRYTDGKRFIVGKNEQEGMTDTLYDLYYDGKNPVEIKARKTVDCMVNH